MKDQIQIAEDLQISLENHLRGIPDENVTECRRFAQRIVALNSLISLAKRVESKEIEKVVNDVIKKWTKDGQVALKNQEARTGWVIIPTDRAKLTIEIVKYLKG